MWFKNLVVFAFFDVVDAIAHGLEHNITTAVVVDINVFTVSVCVGHVIVGKRPDSACQK